jgi:diguanylate cyclase (GGDEF)-like protein
VAVPSGPRGKPERMPLPAPHRIARLYYVPRSIGFALVLIASLFLFAEGTVEPVLLPYAVLVFLVYPHLAYFRACLAREKKRAELQHLVLDAFLLGSWVAAIGFNLGLGFALLGAACLNSAMTGGMTGLSRAVGGFAAGAAVAILVLGFRFTPQEHLGVTVLALASVLVYMMIVAVLFHSQNRRLVGIRDEIERKKRLFESLASAGLALADTQALDALVDVWLDHVGAVLPAGSRIGVVLRDSRRPRLIRLSAFRDIEPAQQAWLLSKLVESDPPSSRQGTLRAADGVDYQLMATDRAPRSSGVFVLGGAAIDAGERRALELFLHQLGAALENHALTQRLIDLANTDGLTGLANRACLDAALAQAIAQKRRQPGSDFTVFVADINCLKQINDGHGHEAGDQLIVAAARIIRSTCRETDIAARAGGDEFVILCPSTTREEGNRLLQRLEQAFGETRLTLPGSADPPQSVRLSVSIGCADSRECDPDDVLKHADQRMYADKEAFYRQRAGPLARPESRP